MSKEINVESGSKFGKLTIVEELPKVAIKRKDRIRKYRTFLCACECGNKTKVRLEYLRSGATRSCGCLAVAGLKTRSISHGHSFSRTYTSWSHMKARCNNKNDIWHQKYYSEISYCDSWNDFKTFLADMGERPVNKSLDRIDPFGNYSKDNCRWASQQEQMNNLRKSPRRGLGVLST